MSEHKNEDRVHFDDSIVGLLGGYHRYYLDRDYHGYFDGALRFTEDLFPRILLFRVHKG